MANVEMQLKFEVSEDGRKVTMAIIDHNGNQVKEPITYPVPFDQTPDEFMVALSRLVESKWVDLGYDAKAHPPEQVHEA